MNKKQIWLVEQFNRGLKEMNFSLDCVYKSHSYAKQRAFDWIKSQRDSYDYATPVVITSANCMKFSCAYEYVFPDDTTGEIKPWLCYHTADNCYEFAIPWEMSVFKYCGDDFAWEI